MSAIPPSAVSSVLQSGVVQKDAARAVDTARTQDGEASRRAQGAADAIVEIEATDNDTQVHTDSGGLGSQGRYDARPDEEPAAEEATADVTLDESGRAHIDLSA